MHNLLPSLDSLRISLHITKVLLIFVPKLLIGKFTILSPFADIRLQGSQDNKLQAAARSRQDETRGAYFCVVNL